MNKRSSIVVRGLICGLLYGVLTGPGGGCGASSALVVVRPEAAVPGAARVNLIEADGDVFKFMVYNQSGEPMVVNRDAVVLQSAAGVRQRVPGGLASQYEIPPGGAHDVNVRFSLEGLQPGEQVYVQFQGAITINGQTVAIEPIIFVRR